MESTHSRNEQTVLSRFFVARSVSPTQTILREKIFFLLTPIIRKFRRASDFQHSCLQGLKYWNRDSVFFFSFGPCFDGFILRQDLCSWWEGWLLACKAERERGLFYLREAYRSHGRILTHSGWVLFPHVDQSVSSKLQDNGWLSLRHMPTLVVHGEGHSDWQSLGPQEWGRGNASKRRAVSRQDQLIQHTSRKDTIFPQDALCSRPPTLCHLKDPASFTH